MANSNAAVVTALDSVFKDLGIKPDDAGTFVDTLTQDQLMELIRLVKAAGGTISVNASGNLVMSPVPADTSSN